MSYKSENDENDEPGKLTVSTASRPGPHRWKPGQSGNPRGAPRKGNALAQAIRWKADPNELVDIALDLARNGEAESTRMQALTWLRDSGYLRPAERHELIARTDRGDLDDDDLALDGLSLDQLLALQAARAAFDTARARILDGAIDVPALPSGLKPGGVPTTNH